MKKSFLMVLLISLVVWSCTDLKTKENNTKAIDSLQIENDSLKAIIAIKAAHSNDKIATFLTFQKEDAEKAMNLYVALFDNSKILEVKRWGKEGPGKEGTIMHATFTLNGKSYMCSDSPAIHEWGFTPAVSNFVSCEDVKELEQLFSKLSEGGKVMMPLNNYGFSQKFGWVEDQFGISWQLNLE